ncbi:MAG: VCBS repeat-containing protein, partial [Planctomycetes bacterium]|nr:VCBS repeat-containing protein [Planctomycetota bacterium]
FTPQTTSVMPWKVHRISQNAVPGTRKYSHGLGLGDINLDGRLDILIKEGWWESPENPNGQTWTFHSANWGEDSAQMFAYDFDGDGDQDILSSDVNGDGLPDFVTGKRWYAHGGRDPGGNDPAVFFWYELRRSGTHPEWIRHPIDSNSGPGTQFEVHDVNQDGMLDVVTSNKKGTHLFLQKRN